jgi:hypothetical protein
MTQDEIRTIAKKAGFLTGLTQDNKPFIWHLFVEDNNLLPEIELFAKLISEVEQKKYEEIAMKVAEEAIDLAMSLEREACAKACENIMNDLKNWPSAFEGVTAETKFIHSIGETIAQPFIEAIRARAKA